VKLFGTKVQKNKKAATLRLPLAQYGFALAYYSKYLFIDVRQPVCIN
jgi:hypothetical protein